MLADLTREERLQLLRFVCSFAWADQQIRPKERQFVRRLVDRLGLADEREQIEAWLTVPPDPETIDPMQIPHAHRRLFVDAAHAVALADGDLAPEEREELRLLAELTQVGARPDTN
jgi:uncharacterized tellurite resistance protein B-like protein